MSSEAIPNAPAAPRISPPLAAAPAPAVPRLAGGSPAAIASLLGEARALLAHLLRWLLAVPLYYLGAVSVYRRWRSRRLATGELRVLRYHRVIPDGDREPVYRLGVGRASFARQMRFLARAYQVVDVAGAERFLAGPPAGGGMRVLVTLDDGYRDNLTEGLPGLLAADVPALLFITTGPVGSGSRFPWERLKRAVEDPRRAALPLPGGGALPIGRSGWRRRAAYRALEDGFLALATADREAVLALWEGGRPRDGRNDGPLTWDEVRELRDRGLALGAHTVSHPFLTRLGDEDLRRELRDSARQLREQIERPVDALAYPAGDHDDRVVRETAAAGYRLAFTTRSGSNLPGDGRWTLRRKGIAGPSAENPLGGFSRALFAAEVCGLFDHLLRGSLR